MIVALNPCYEDDTFEETNLSLAAELSYCKYYEHHLDAVRARYG